MTLPDLENDALEELMGEVDDVDVFFLLPGASEGEPLVLRVMGVPELSLAWVH